MIVLVDVAVGSPTIDRDGCKSFEIGGHLIHENCGEFIWKLFWTVLYGFVAIFLFCHLPQCFSLRTKTRLRAFKRHSVHIWHGSLLMILSTASTIFLVIDDLETLNMGQGRQIILCLCNGTQFLLLYFLDPIKNYVTKADEAKKSDNKNKCPNCSKLQIQLNGMQHELRKSTIEVKQDPIKEFRRSNKWRIMMIVLCLLNAYNILYSFVFSTQNYYDLVDSEKNTTKNNLFYLSYGTSFATSQFSTWALFQFVDFLLNILLNEKERQKNKQRSKISVGHKYTHSVYNPVDDGSDHKGSYSIFNSPALEPNVPGKSGSISDLLDLQSSRNLNRETSNSINTINTTTNVRYEQIVEVDEKDEIQ